MVHAAEGGVNVCGIFKGHSLSVAFKHLFLTMSTPLWPQGIHLLVAAPRRIKCHVKKIRSFQTGFLNKTIRSSYSNGLQHHQISIQEITFGLWWNRIWDAVMLAQMFPHLFKSMPRRQLWKQKYFHPSTSKVYLIKCPLNVCMSVHTQALNYQVKYFEVDFNCSFNAFWFKWFWSYLAELITSMLAQLCRDLIKLHPGI